MARFNIFLILLFFSKPIFAQDFSLYQKKDFRQAGETLPYRILYPLNYDSTKKYPLILFLHGSGERGIDNEKQLSHGGNLFLKDSIRMNFPSFVVFPQCPESSFWSNVIIKKDSIGTRKFTFLTGGEPNRSLVLTEALIQKLLYTLPVYKRKVYVMGLSMGGMGTFEIVGRNPHLFAAAIPICGGANPETAKILKKTKWWIFHGAKDDTVSPEFSIQMAEALKKEKANVKFTLYPEEKHDSWDKAFSEPSLLPWLFDQHR
jgi:predicted peptidase